MKKCTVKAEKYNAEEEVTLVDRAKKYYAEELKLNDDDMVHGNDVGRWLLHPRTSLRLLPYKSLSRMNWS
ncbi:hypothetical protein RHGRI_038958 [Rhododendron griersonianum]|uniref:Uncharacterized protein n=1 Tax=Rhododendron griersonianum TaxID=479676 RepID=A0AAV6HKR7_9ERIC|nr:hypothetical protein RHGRI_038958 [Rhododendron griersonianum]